MKLNHFTIWIAIVLQFGFIWHGPLLGAQWIEMVGLILGD